MISFRFVFRFSTLSLLLFFFISGCNSTQTSTKEPNITIKLIIDGQTRTVNAVPGTNVQRILESDGVILGNLDKVDPENLTIATDGLSVKIIRGREVFETRSISIPFERQTVRNESMPLGETRLLQPGSNGTQEVIYRNYYEDDQLISSSITRTAISEQALPEIVMIGVQTPFVPLPIPGKLLYISGGNAWLMQSSTSKRTPLVTTGDLDGRILKLSNDRKWLLYSRKSTKAPEIEINSLWALNIDNPKATPLDLKTPNIVHFADWDPTTVSTLRILYSTVEPRAASPGWQANNDLYRMIIGTNGNLGVREKIIEANTGGVYGWWGTDYVWAPSSNLLAYSRPDGIGIVSFKNKTLISIMNMAPLQTHSDWALIPGLGWGADGRTIYAVAHSSPPGIINPEESPNFDLNAISLDTDANIRLVQQSGMFAYPASSSARIIGKERSYSIAYLQALTPSQSGSSGYKLIIMDRDGSNKRSVFPKTGSPGLDPQSIVWAPAPLSLEEGDFLSVIYQGNIWLIDAATNTGHQVTSDGLIQKIVWK